MKSKTKKYKILQTKIDTHYKKVIDTGVTRVTTTHFDDFINLAQPLNFFESIEYSKSKKEYNINTNNLKADKIIKNMINILNNRQSLCWAEERLIDLAILEYVITFYEKDKENIIKAYQNIYNNKHNILIDDDYLETNLSRISFISILQLSTPKNKIFREVKLSNTSINATLNNCYNYKLINEFNKYFGTQLPDLIIEEEKVSVVKDIDSECSNVNHNSVEQGEQVKLNSISIPFYSNMQLFSVSELDKEIIIPIYQRNYVWPKRIVDDLLNNILNINNDSMGVLPLSQICLTDEKGSDNYVLVDGQQRITTLVLILYGYMNIIKQKYNIGAISDENSKKILEIYSYLSKDILAAQGNDVLYWLSSHNDSFQSLLSIIHPDREPSCEDKCTQYYTNYLYITNWLEEQLDESNLELFFNNFMYKTGFGLIIHTDFDGKYFYSQINSSINKIELSITDKMEDLIYSTLPIDIAEKNYPALNKVYTQYQKHTTASKFWIGMSYVLGYDLKSQDVNEFFHNYLVQKTTVTNMAEFTENLLPLNDYIYIRDALYGKNKSTSFDLEVSLKDIEKEMLRHIANHYKVLLKQGFEPLVMHIMYNIWRRDTRNNFQEVIKMLDTLIQVALVWWINNPKDSMGSSFFGEINLKLLNIRDNDSLLLILNKANRGIVPLINKVVNKDYKNLLIDLNDKTTINEKQATQIDITLLQFNNKKINPHTMQITADNYRHNLINNTGLSADHIFPKSKISKSTFDIKLKNSLGNFVIISTTGNSSFGNIDFSQKRDKYIGLKVNGINDIIIDELLKFKKFDISEHDKIIKIKEDILYDLCNQLKSDFDNALTY